MYLRVLSLIHSWWCIWPTTTKPTILRWASIWSLQNYTARDFPAAVQRPHLVMVTLTQKQFCTRIVCFAMGGHICDFVILFIESDKESACQSDKGPVNRSTQESVSQVSGSSRSSHEKRSLVSSGRQSTSNEIIIPQQWQEDTQACINAKVLTQESRGNICRTLVTLVTAKYRPNPGKGKIDDIARKLILKYPFMKDDMGSWYVSRTYMKLETFT